jgi:hypothetical protein
MTYGMTEDFFPAVQSTYAQVDPRSFDNDDLASINVRFSGDFDINFF